MMIPREILGSGAIQGAIDCAGEWGYPRDITSHEFEEGLWYGLERNDKILMLWWFEPASDGVAGWHTAAAPSIRGRVPVRSYLGAVRITAQLNWLHRLIVRNPGEIVAGYLDRLGLVRVLDLGNTGDDIWCWEVDHVGVTSRATRSSDGAAGGSSSAAEDSEGSTG